MDFDELTAVAKRHHYFHVFRALELCFERYEHATMVVLGFVSNVGLSSLIGDSFNCRTKGIRFVSVRIITCKGKLKEKKNVFHS